MRTQSFSGHAALLLFLLGASVPASAQPFQLISVADPSQGPAAGGSGDSGAPVISADGRYVLFASTANNLVLTTNNTPIPVHFPACLNVFLRDRTNATTTLISVNLTGNEGGNGDSLPVDISTNGQYVLFESSASDLAPGDTNNAADIFVRDLVNGTSILVSVSTNGAAANGVSRSAAMTPDAHYVAFVSEANNLVPADTNGIPDVFVRDLWSGVTTRASVGAFRSGYSSECPDITPDGRYVAFYSTARGLTPESYNYKEIYVRDMTLGTTVWASAGAPAAVDSALHQYDWVCYNHAISADGKFVVYEAHSPSSPGYPGLILRYSMESGSTTLVHTNAAVLRIAGLDSMRSLDMTPDGQRIAFSASTNGIDGSTTCIMLWDAATGDSTLVSGDRANQAAINSICDWPAIDATGRFVTFASNGTNLTSNTLIGAYHLYLRDTQSGTTVLLDADTDGVGSLISPATIPRLSADGRFVAFECADASLIPNDRNRQSDVFVRDLTTGAIELVSARHPALPSIAPNGLSSLSSSSLSADGRYVAFASDADNLVANDTNRCRDVFVRDQLNNTNILVSVGNNGATANGPSFEPAITTNGLCAAFTSRATNLVSGDSNGKADVFVRDLANGTNALVSVNSGGTGSANGDSYSPSISAAGRYILFLSQASNLAGGSFSGENLFFRDLQTRTTYALTTSGWKCAAMTPDGRYVAFVDIVSGVSGKLYVWDSTSASRVYTNSTSSLSAVGISPDGNRLAFWAGSTSLQMTVVDLAAGTNGIVGPNSAVSPRTIRFSADNRYLVYTAAVNNTNQVYLYDFQTRSNALISQSYYSSSPAGGASDSPDISADDRFVAYRSAAPDLVPGDTNGVPDIILYDRQTRATTLLTASRIGAFAAGNRSLSPLFSADGQTLLFLSWAPDLGGTDFNQASDVFAYSLSFSGSIPLFFASILPGNLPSQGPWVSWAAVAGRTYRVQFKNNLHDPTWQDLGSSVTIIGNQAYSPDLTPGATRRFYRVQAF